MKFFMSQNYVTIKHVVYVTTIMASLCMHAFFFIVIPHNVFV